MEELKNAINSINNFMKDETIKSEIKWENLFILTCNIIDNLGSYKKVYIDNVIQMLSEYDFEKNREESVK